MNIKKVFFSMTVCSTLFSGCSQNPKEVISANKHKPSHHEIQKQKSSKTENTPISKNSAAINNTSSKAIENFNEIVITDDSQGWAMSNKKVFIKDHNKWVDITPAKGKLINNDNIFENLYAFNENLAWVTYGDTIFKSKNHGKTWESSNLPTTGSTGINFTFINSTTGWMLVHSGYATGHSPFDIYKTTNQGKSWKLVYHVGNDTNNGIPDTKDPSDITFVDDKHGFITGQGNDPHEIIFYKTNDAGQIWKQSNVPLPYLKSDDLIGFRAPQFFNQNKGILQVDIEGINNVFTTILYSTNNQGKTWNRLYNMNGTGEITFLDKKIGWANIRKNKNDTNASTNFKTNDGGSTWKKISTANFSLNSLNFTSSQIGWGINDKTSQLMQSRDGGVTWKVAPR